MKKMAICLLMVLLSLSPALYSQTYDLYTSDNSDLYYNQVYCINFDNDGNIWFGGQRDAVSGLAKVCRLSSDLSTWTVFEQSDLGLSDLEDRVFYMACDNQNTMWLCTHYGFAYYMDDGTADYVDFTFDDYSRTVQTDSDGNIYLSDRTAVGIYVSYDNGANWDLWTVDTLGMPEGDRPEIYDLREDSMGQLWLCTWYGVYYKDTESVWHSVEEIAGAYTYAMTVDPNDKLWVPDNGTNDLYEIDAADGSLTIHDASEWAVLSNTINDLEADADGNLWLATVESGIIKLDPAAGTFTVYDSANTAGQVVQNNITHMEIKDGVIWASTETEGILRIEGLVTSVNDEQPEMATRITLNDNYPNPFNPVTTISFHLPKAADVTLAIYNLQGQLVNTIAYGGLTAGDHTYTWDATDMTGNVVASGIYIYQLQSEEQRISKKMLLIK